MQILPHFIKRLEYPGLLLSTNMPKIWKNDYTSFFYPNHPSRSLTVLPCRKANLSPSSLPNISLEIPRDCPFVPQICPCHLPPNHHWLYQCPRQPLYPSCCPKTYSPSSYCCLNFTPNLVRNPSLNPPQCHLIMDRNIWDFIRGQGMTTENCNSETRFSLWLPFLLSSLWNWVTAPRNHRALGLHVSWSPTGLPSHSQDGPGPQKHLHLRPLRERKNWGITLKGFLPSLAHLRTEETFYLSTFPTPRVKSWT